MSLLMRGSRICCVCDWWMRCSRSWMGDIRASWRVCRRSTIVRWSAISWVSMTALRWSVSWRSPIIASLKSNARDFVDIGEMLHPAPRTMWYISDILPRYRLSFWYICSISWDIWWNFKIYQVYVSYVRRYILCFGDICSIFCYIIVRYMTIF